MMEKTPGPRSAPEAQPNSPPDSDSRAKKTNNNKIFENLPGTDEGKAALIEFEMAEMDFVDGDIVEEQQTFDFGAEFQEAPPTAVMLDTGSFIPTGLTEDADFSGDDDAQLDFEEAARLIALEDAERGNRAPEELELSARDTATMLDETALLKLKVGTDEELMRSIKSIPEKMAFKIGEVAEMIGVKQYVLRYWESEFDALRPRKSKNGQRVYTRREVETALMIKKLLYTDRFSIEGARGALKQLKSKVREEKGWNQLLVSHDHVKDGLKGLLSEIRKLKEVLS